MSEPGKRVILQDDTTEGAKHLLEVYIDSSGDLVFEGYYRGELIEDFWGNWDYEFRRRVEASRVPEVYCRLVDPRPQAQTTLDEGAASGALIGALKRRVLMLLERVGRRGAAGAGHPAASHPKHIRNQSRAKVSLETSRSTSSAGIEYTQEQLLELIEERLKDDADVRAFLEHAAIPHTYEHYP